VIGPLRFHTGDEGLPRISPPPQQSGPATKDRRKARRGGLALIAPLLFVLGMVAPQGALGATLVPVSVTIHVPPTASIGSEVIVTATVRRADRIAPTGLRIGLYLGGKYLGSSHADTVGNLDFRISPTVNTTAGSFTLEARFDGARGLAPARTSTTLKIRAAQVTVTTVPAVTGIPITVGDAKATTGADGTAKLSINKVGSVALEAHLDLLTDPSIRVSFTRWGDQVYDLKRNINVRGDATYVLGLRTAYRAAVQFVDVAGTTVDPTAISRARFTSSSGGELVLTNFDNVWWEAGTAVSRTGGLQPSETLWRLTEVEMAGTNVVNQGQQAFSPAINGVFTINLLLYDLVVHTEDALTRSGLTGNAELVFPDSSSKTLPLAADGSVHFNALPRGSYSVKLTTSGITPPTPIALSRSQEVTIRAISNVDIAAGIGLTLLVLFALLWIGRRRQMPWLMRATSAPMVIVRRLPLESASAAVSRRLPSARSAVGRVPADLASIGSTRWAAALAFARLVVARVARTILLVIATVARVSVAAVRRIALVGKRTRVDGTETAETGRADVRGGRAAASRTPATEQGPSWPTPIGGEAQAAPDPFVSARAPRPGPNLAHRGGDATTGAPGWFDVLEDEGPTHECRRCHRQVPDSARFCRSCGHLQA
jgi:hypothetical protein